MQFNGRASGAWCPYATGADLDSDQQVDDGYSLVFDSPPLVEGFEILGAPAWNWNWRSTGRWRSSRPAVRRR